VLAPTIEVSPGRQRNTVEREDLVVGRGFHPFAVRAANRHAGDGGPRLARFEGLDQSRHRAFAVVQHDRVDGGGGEGGGIRGGCVSADDQRHVRRDTPDAGDELEHVFGLEGMHRCHADEFRTLREVVLDRTAEAKIDQRDVVTAGLERGRDVLHAERLDSEEGTEAEPFVAWNGTEQQYVHESNRQVSTEVLYSRPATRVPSGISCSL
jgi:hypothetical protein